MKAAVKDRLFLFTVVCVSQHKLCGSARENKAGLIYPKVVFWGGTLSYQLLAKLRARWAD